MTKVIKINDGLEFDDGSILFSQHHSDCCENHWLAFDEVELSEFDGLKFDLSKDDFFERIEGFGIALKPINGFPVRIAGYGRNNGYYTANIHLVLKTPNGVRDFDVTECQDYFN